MIFEPTAISSPLRAKSLEVGLLHLVTPEAHVAQQVVLAGKRFLFALESSITSNSRPFSEHETALLRLPSQQDSALGTQF